MLVGYISLALPAAFITFRRTAIMVLLLFLVAPVRANQFSALASQTLRRRTTVIAFIVNQRFRIVLRVTWTFAPYSNIIQCFIQQFDLEVATFPTIAEYAINRARILETPHH